MAFAVNRTGFADLYPTLLYTLLDVLRDNYLCVVSYSHACLFVSIFKTVQAVFNYAHQDTWEIAQLLSRFQLICIGDLSFLFCWGKFKMREQFPE